MSNQRSLNTKLKELLTFSIALLGFGQTACTQPEPPAAPSVTDVGYLQSMARHHEQALFLSQIAQDAAQGEVRAIAWAMSTAQSKELGRIQQWLTDQGQSPAPKGPLMQWVEDLPETDDIADQLFKARCRANANSMPGNISVATFQAVSKATALEKGRMFLEIMINHHQAAVDMSNFANRHATAPFVKSLTQTVAREQQLEVGRMQNLLSQLSKSKSMIRG